MNLRITPVAFLNLMALATKTRQSKLAPAAAENPHALAGSASGAGCAERGFVAEGGSLGSYGTARFASKKTDEIYTDDIDDQDFNGAFDLITPAS